MVHTMVSGAAVAMIVMYVLVNNVMTFNVNTFNIGKMFQVLKKKCK